jgi:hypothetical protein
MEFFLKNGPLFENDLFQQHGPSFDNWNPTLLLSQTAIVLIYFEVWAVV